MNIFLTFFFATWHDWTISFIIDHSLISKKPNTLRKWNLLSIFWFSDTQNIALILRAFNTQQCNKTIQSVHNSFKWNFLANSCKHFFVDYRIQKCILFGKRNTKKLFLQDFSMFSFSFKIRMLLRIWDVYVMSNRKNFAAPVTVVFRNNILCTSHPEQLLQ